MPQLPDLELQGSSFILSFPKRAARRPSDRPSLPGRHPRQILSRLLLAAISPSPLFVSRFPPDSSPRYLAMRSGIHRARCCCNSRPASQPAIQPARRPAGRPDCGCALWLSSSTTIAAAMARSRGIAWKAADCETVQEDNPTGANRGISPTRSLCRSVIVFLKPLLKHSHCEAHGGRERQL
ncbi:hypothetical protein MPTK1_6g04890 [Marchantia polymorpha subsp. ruderalis]|uniref:Uncharacterized protein n=2 Tax=Marchantia polymorpha TaxID=3197 RepID=A0AAF6BNL5_MARPO|nr:hypothetical protein MARPO_0034s0028 [Marchantia polymorpha]BBN13599.1 hypothetical protein Mp_6g04890 [Marchantia polymorpha subsp. ruderalis]|eukprot:PTQ41431.1 hypothetical protein MARPO_0034s0028 [Marchantia polymorpha]